MQLRKYVGIFSGDKYCSYVIKEGGVPLLQMVVDDNRSSSSMRSLALTVLSNIEKWLLFFYFIINLPKKCYSN